MKPKVQSLKNIHKIDKPLAGLMTETEREREGWRGGGGEREMEGGRGGERREREERRGQTEIT